VFLRSCIVGAPGIVLRLERSKVVIHWADLDMIGRHSPAALMAVPRQASESLLSRPPAERIDSRSNDSTYATASFSKRENPGLPAGFTSTLQPLQETFTWQR
jgi:hypothetical protein